MDTRSVEMCIEMSNRIQRSCESITLYNYSLDNAGNLSQKDTRHNLLAAEKRLLEYVNTLIGKERLISIKDLAKRMSLAEDVVTAILERNGMYVDDGDEE